jgi:hypothetical protein
VTGEIVSGGGGRKKAAPVSGRPLSDLTAAGWEVRHYHALTGTSGMLEHLFHLSRPGENKLLVVRRNMMGKGMFSEEFDV